MICLSDKSYLMKKLCLAFGDKLHPFFTYIYTNSQETKGDIYNIIC